MIKKWQIFTIFLLGIIFLPFSFVLAGTVLSDYKYSWTDNVGYINFENVIVENGALSGFAWSKNSGWIKFGIIYKYRGFLHPISILRSYR